MSCPTRGTRIEIDAMELLQGYDVVVPRKGHAD